MASVSTRRWIRWLPDGVASEPTSTIVVTSPDNNFVDVRVSIPQSHDRQGVLDWAFAGISTRIPGRHGDPMRGKWEHYVDSRTKDVEGVRDEGVLRPGIDDGLVVEIESGEMVNPETGQLQGYEECWQDVDVGGPEVWVAAFEGNTGVNEGRVVRVGNWCQGILRRGKEVTVERWEKMSGSWVKTFSAGRGKIPTQQALINERLPVDAEFELDGVEWVVFENIQT